MRSRYGVFRVVWCLLSVLVWRCNQGAGQVLLESPVLFGGLWCNLLCTWVCAHGQGAAKPYSFACQLFYKSDANAVLRLRGMHLRPFSSVRSPICVFLGGWLLLPYLVIPYSFLFPGTT